MKWKQKQFLKATAAEVGIGTRFLSSDGTVHTRGIIDVPEVCATSEAARARRLPPNGPHRNHTEGKSSRW